MALNIPEKPFVEKLGTDVDEPGESITLSPCTGFDDSTIKVTLIPSGIGIEVEDGTGDLYSVGNQYICVLSNIGDVDTGCCDNEPPTSQCPDVLVNGVDPDDNAGDLHTVTPHVHACDGDKLDVTITGGCIGECCLHKIECVDTIICFKPASLKGGKPKMYIDTKKLLRALKTREKRS